MLHIVPNTRLRCHLGTRGDYQPRGHKDGRPALHTYVSIAVICLLPWLHSQGKQDEGTKNCYSGTVLDGDWYVL